MAIALITLGGLLFVIGLRGNATQFYSLIANDVKSGFLYWLLAIVAIGFLGTIPTLRTFANYLLVLVLLAIVLKNPNFVANAKQFVGVS